MPPRAISTVKVSVYKGGKVVSGGRAATVLETKTGGQNSTLAFIVQVPVGASATAFDTLLETGAVENDIDLAAHFIDMITGNQVSIHI